MAETSMGREFAIGLWLWPLALADICALLLITLALHSLRARAVWLWVILPQTAVVSAAAFLFYWLEQVDYLGMIITFALISQFPALLVAVIGRRHLKYIWLLCHIIFVILWGCMEPVNSLQRAILEGWEGKQISHLHQRMEQ
ncbi:TPA: hypothetical protein ACN6ZP_000299 [Escherichia albertii]